MSRAVDTDFKSLTDFISNYSLGHLTENPEHLATVKSAHKLYLPFLQLWSICFNKAQSKELEVFDISVNIDGAEILFLRETVSDIGSSLFCCLHGAYKPAFMALRSSIENYLRFSAGLFDQSALTTTSTYDLFEIAKKTKVFYGANNRHWHILHNTYIELCRYTHSATLEHMSGIHALDHFPTFNSEHFQRWIEHTKAVTTSIATTLITASPSIFVNAHYQAQELLEVLIPKTERLNLLKGK